MFVQKRLMSQPAMRPCCQTTCTCGLKSSSMMGAGLKSSRRRDFTNRFTALRGGYPSPEECLEEIRLARAECLSAANSGDADHALFWLPVWEEWSRRLEVGTFLRHGEVRRYQSMQGYLIRKKLELLEHELEHDPYEPEEVRRVVQSIMATDSRWVRSFRNPH